LYNIFEIKVNCCIALPVDILCTKFRKNPTFKTQVTRWRTSENLNQVFTTSRKWDLPGSSTKCFNWNVLHLEAYPIFAFNTVYFTEEQRSQTVILYASHKTKHSLHTSVFM